MRKPEAFWWHVRHRVHTALLRKLRRRGLESEFAFGPPTGQPRLTRKQAIRLALTNPQPSARFHAEYGRYQSVNHRRGAVQPDGSMRYEGLPPFNAWKVTVTGISMPRPGGRSGSLRRPPPITVMVVIVDDETGVVQSASGS